ncbi:DUF5666 domain-containing protein [Occallatibacter riparius]|uniref:DUF5666 domain-containing protein n=1 Tax=Occallatibacter riparius TaxID=1002689 RepID=A0A9J7BI79_9BACT|nr:DUF5666 domain-containing protein [Occallatibacter riparius]UWZ82415.1 DUF5666 domain-containing protein [Occallatibacter riparius]
MKIRIAFTKVLALMAALTVFISVPAGLHAQASRLVGTVTAINGTTLTVKTDSGEQQQVAVPDTATLKRLAPGEKDLNAAPAIQLTDVAVGDRVLIKLDAGASSPTASLLVAMKQADVAQVHQKDNDAWQRGVAGLVKSVDLSSGSITVTSGAGPTAKTVTVKTTGSTQLLRYPPDSIRFADAKPAPLSAIQTGDQLRARGSKNADGTEIAADAVVSGTFRNIAGTISSLDPNASSLVVKDLATKKTVTIHIPADAQMRRIPDRAAQALAAHLKGTGGAGAGAWQGGGAGMAAGGSRGAAPGAPNSTPPAGGQAGGAPPTTGPGGQGARWGGGPGGQGAAGAGDPQHMLSMAPAIKITDLQKGEAVMVVSTNGSSDVNAITVLAGVEPLLTAPEARNLLSNWSVGGGGGAEAAAGPQ